MATVGLFSPNHASRPANGRAYSIHSRRSRRDRRPAAAGFRSRRRRHLVACHLRQLPRGPARAVPGVVSVAEPTLMVWLGLSVGVECRRGLVALDPARRLPTESSGPLSRCRKSAPRSAAVHGRRWNYRADLGRLVGDPWRETMAAGRAATHLPRPTSPSEELPRTERTVTPRGASVRPCRTHVRP